MKKLLYFTFLLFIGGLQAQDFSGIIESYFSNNRTTLNLEQQDVSDFTIQSQHFSKSTAVHHVYVTQRFQGIEIFNGIMNFTIKNNEVFSVKNGFVNNLSSKINTLSPSLSPFDAIQNAASKLGIGVASGVQQLESQGNNTYLFSKGNISQENITVKLVYQPMDEFSKLHLAWDLNIYILDGKHWYSVRVDAQSGDLLEIHDWVNECNFNYEVDHSHFTAEAQHFLFKSAASPQDGSQYRVLPMPVESPNHGSLSLEVEPANQEASPFGWHDTDGVPGPEFTVTRGNNVRARADLLGNNTGESPDGGPDLNFDLPYNFNAPSFVNTDAVTVNLFYWNNIIHDVWYQYGFDEPSGNFQENNYGNGGSGNDSVNADSQDGSGTNNANFGTPPDGMRPRMQMYLWNTQGPSVNPLTINTGTVAGSYAAVRANFGAPLPYLEPLTADMVLVEDDIDNFEGCGNITNSADINGKIAVLRRGTCQFGFKALQAQNAGAVAVIVVNNEPGNAFAMAPGDDGVNVNILTVMMPQGAGENVISALLDDETINATFQDQGPFPFDSSLDSGVIAHEYGHGISNRLTGGRFVVNCLQNDEQMGEGWSDWIGLVMTMQEGDTPEQNRGVGTYLINQPTTGNGIRPAPYSTSFSVNPATYGLTNSASLSQPHGIGFVWATMLWDLTWALIDEYGFDPDFYNGTGGNNIAMQLVTDGMKLQNCSPGFVDGRDAILEADELAYDGVHSCLIWEVFARRGLGVSASQGSPFNRFDQVEAFDVPEVCLLGTSDHSSNAFSIYPNPAQGSVNIYSSVNMGDTTVTIFDINGRKVLHENVVLNGLITLDINNLNSGLYIVQVNGESQSHTTKLIIK